MSHLNFAGWSQLAPRERAELNLHLAIKKHTTTSRHSLTKNLEALATIVHLIDDLPGLADQMEASTPISR